MSSKLISDLFAQSIQAQYIVNNTFEFLKQGDTPLSKNLALELFLKGTDYHKALVQNIKEIIRLTKEEKEKLSINKEVQKILNKTEPFYNKKLLVGLNILSKIEFIPKDLSICPKCGRFFNDEECRKYPVTVNNKVLGYSFKCIEDRNNGNFKENKES